MTIRRATGEDLPAITRLLEGAGLPTEDVPLHVESFLVSCAGESLTGVIGLERYGHVGLLRSLAVESGRRGQGSGRALCERLFRFSEMKGVQDLYLLTTDAAEYFKRLGFAELDRALAPDKIKKCREFATLCPDTATLMTLRLKEPR